MMAVGVFGVIVLFTKSKAIVSDLHFLVLLYFTLPYLTLPCFALAYLILPSCILPLTSSQMIVFLVFCILDLIINVIQAIIAAIVTALVGIMKNALDDNNCKELNGKCYCTYTEDTSGLRDADFEGLNASICSHLKLITRALGERGRSLCGKLMMNISPPPYLALRTV